MIAAGQYDPAAPQFKNLPNLSAAEVQTVKLRLKLALEELSEHFASCLTPRVDNIFQIHFSVLQKLLDLLIVDDLQLNMQEIVDSLTDIKYINTGSAIAFGVDLDKAFNIVHDNNMTKVDPETGMCTKNESGKVVKPPGYKPPVLTDCLV
jgi:predicted HAD superfamily Cof-like phosphohydrolase